MFMSVKIYKANCLDSCLRFGDLQILHLQGTLSNGDNIKIQYPYIFSDTNYSLIVGGNYGNTIDISSKYKDCCYLNINGKNGYNTGKYELIAVGKFK